jgi:alpha-beta hydrolase superfamily lysophospholipase
MENGMAANVNLQSSQAQPVRFRVEIDVSAVTQALGEPARMVTEVILPAGTDQPHALLVCIPGGGMNRQYFDLPAPDTEPGASFAAAMVKEGFAVALLDPVGIGESTVPRDPYLLHPEIMAAANGAAARHLLHGLRQGTLRAGSPAWPSLKSIGVGHSFGALLTTIQEAADPMHCAVAIMGSHVRGWAQFCMPEELAMDPADIRARLVELTRARYPNEPYMKIDMKPSKQPVKADPALEPMLIMTSLLSIIPNITAKDAAAVKVPVMLAFGDADIHIDADFRTAPAAFTGSNDISLLILPNTRHNHFVYPSRTLLFARIAQWAKTVLA